MHVAMIIDEERLDHEHAMLNRVCVGLIAAGAQVTRLVPRSVQLDTPAERAVSIAERIIYQPRGVPWMESKRIEEVAGRFDRSAPDIVYAVGVETWALSVRLAKRFDIPLVIDVWSAQILPPRSLGRDLEIKACYVAATRGIARELKRRTSERSIAVVPVGVSVPQTPSPVFEDATNTIDVAVIGRAASPKAYRGLITALARFVKQYPQLHIFLELDGKHEHAIWRLLKSAGILGHVSTFVRAHMHRTMLVRVDVFILPERLGEMRTLVLDIMAAGVPIIAISDPALDILISDKTATVLPVATVDAWCDKLGQVIHHPDRAAKLGRTARSWIAENHRPSEQIRLLYDVLEGAVTGGAIAFVSSEG